MLVASRKYILAIECIFCVAAGLIKISILLFYRRLSSRVVSKAFRWTTWITIGFIIAYTIALTLAPILGCQPISAFWDQVDITKRLKGYKYHCFDEGADLFAAGVISSAQDLLTAILPTFLYWNLQISRRQKVALFGIFALGYGAVALGGLRAYYSYRTFYLTYDVTWSTYDVFFTTLLELHVGAFCANAPTCKVFFKHFFHNKLVSSASSKKTNSRVDSAHSRPKTAASTTTILGKFASIFRGKGGYISESNNSVSVDEHGGVQVQKEVDVIRFPALAVKPTNKHSSVNTLNMLNAHYYSDIEMGNCNAGYASHPSSARTTKNFEGEDLSALPPMPNSPASFHSRKSSRTFFGLKPQEPRSPVIPEVPESPVQSESPALREPLEPRTNKIEARSPTPIPMRTLNEQRPQWQSWS
jgi:hypothetical protein